jgi:hypothetical protein
MALLARLHSVVLADQATADSFREEFAYLAHVRFAPESGHVRCSYRCPLWAKSGHWTNLLQ